MAMELGERRELFILAGLALGTPVCLLIAFGQWSDLGAGDFLEGFNQVPWARISMMLTLITALAARAGLLQSSKVGLLDDAPGYAVVVWFALFLMFPNFEKVGVSGSGSYLALIFLITGLHMGGFMGLRSIYRERFHQRPE